MSAAPEVHTTNTTSNSTGKSAASSGKKVKMGGLTLPASQAVSLPGGQKHETLIIPASSTPGFGSYFTIDIREKNILLHNINLQFNYSAVVGSGLTGYFNPSWYHWTRIECYQGGTVVDTIYGNQQFLMTQLNENDEQRIILNNSAGNYASTAQRTILSSQTTTNTFYCPIKCYLNQAKMSLYSDAHAVQLRVYMDTLPNIFVATAGTLTSCSINSVNAICSVTRHDAVTAHNSLDSIKKAPHHFIAHDTHYGSFAIAAGNTSYTAVLSPIVGKVATLFWTIRPSVVGVGAWNYSQLASFHLLDSASTSLVGGQQIPSALASNIIYPGWTKSSYPAENAIGVVNNGANFYMWSFSADPVSAHENGQALGSRMFMGSEQLILNFPTALTSQVQVDVYAMCENILEVGEYSVKKISM